MPVLKDWYWFGDRLCGAVYGHENFRDGARVITSPIVGIMGDMLISDTGTGYLCNGTTARGALSRNETGLRPSKVEPS